MLCSEIATVLAARGVSVALLGRTLKNVQRVAVEIGQSGGSAKAYACDVLDEDQLKSTREQINSDFGSCDILINGAGGNNPKATTESPNYQEGNSDIRTFFNITQVSLSTDIRSQPNWYFTSY